MAFNKRAWKGRQGTGLNKFSINGATPVTVVNQPDSITEVGDALSAGNLNDLENRIAEAFDETASQEEVTNLSNVLQATNARVENLEQEHGSYQEVTVKSPYTVPSGKAKNWSVNVLKGVTRGKNQLARTTKSTGSISGLTFTRQTDGSYVVTGTANASAINFWMWGDYGQSDSLIPITNGHTYLYKDFYGFSGTSGTGFSTTFGEGWKLMTASSSYSVTGVRSPAAVSGTTYNLTIKPQCIDLTLYFGGTIPSDAQTIADIQQNYPELLVPSEYGSSLVDTEYGGVRSKSRNLFDKSAIIANRRIEDFNGTIVASTGYNVSDFIPIDPSKNYYKTQTSSSRNLFYDANKNPINTGSWAFGSDSTTIPSSSIPSNARYVRMTIYTTYLRTACFNVSDSLDGTSTEYFESTLFLPTPVILRSAGSVAEEFDLESGRVTHPIGSYTFTGQETYSQLGDNPLWSFGLTAKGVSSNDKKGNIICSALDVSTVSAIIADSTLNAISIAQSGTVFISTVAYNNRANLVGKTINYELATPTTEQLDPIENPYLPTEAGGTISSILTDAVDDSMTLGYINL